MEDKLKEQVAGMELGMMFILCVNSGLYMHIPKDHRIDGATGKFPEMPTRTDTTKLEMSMSFLQIKSSMGLHEKIKQVKHEICHNRRDTTHVQLEADNSYSLLKVYG